MMESSRRGSIYGEGMNTSIAYIEIPSSGEKKMEIFNYLEEHKLPFVFQGTKPNQLNSNPYCLAPNEEGATEFNKIYKLLQESKLGQLERTTSGGIQISPRNHHCYDVRHSSNGGIITIYAYGRLYTIKLGHWGVKTKKEIHPYIAFSLFEEKCNEFGIDLDKYTIKNGKEIKNQIPKPYIWMREDLLNTTLYNVHHIDFHNSYPAGLVNTHEEFRPVVEFFYNNRKKHPEYKAVLNYTIGMMQSLKVKTVNAQWSHLSKDAISDNNRRIDELTERLVLNGNDIVGMNTDGIWYRGPVYHGIGEGPKLGEWENDHISCKFRAKSAGAYEFIEKGVYNPVMRGMTSYDKEVPRENWTWGDIYKSGIYVLHWDDEEGFTAEVEDDL